MLFVKKHLSAHNLIKLERQKERGEKKEYKHNFRKCRWESNSEAVCQEWSNSKPCRGKWLFKKRLWGNIRQLSEWDRIQRVHYLYEFGTKFGSASERGLGVCKHTGSALTRECGKPQNVELTAKKINPVPSGLIQRSNAASSRLNNT